jgi:O-antigen ligase
MRGQSSEPIELRPGVSAREAGRRAEIERWAWRRVRSLRFFYTHLTVFLGGNIVLLLIDMSTSGETWFYIPLLGWLLLIGLHAAQAYEMLPWFSDDWEQQKVEELIEEKLRR